MFFQVSSINGIAAVNTPQRNLRQNRRRVWNFTSTTGSARALVWLAARQWACYISLYLSETRPPPGEGELISQCIGFCSCSGLSCCHPLHTAGPCSLCSLLSYSHVTKARWEICSTCRLCRSVTSLLPDRHDPILHHVFFYVSLP